MKGDIFHIKTGAEFACFTRPEFKAERVSYLVMTPSAARGILEAIFWKPAFRWEIRSIKIMRPITQTSILRNEIKTKQEINRQPINIEDKRVQRTSLILKDVEYIISAYMRKLPHTKENFSKYTSQFKRKLEKGQCHHTPYMGTREFAAWFEPSDELEEPNEKINLDLGYMFFDRAFIKDSNNYEMDFYRHDQNQNRKAVKGYTRSLFFPLKVEEGILNIPPEYYHHIYELEGRYV